MRTPTATALLLAALTSIACSEELRATDVPSACTAICGPMVTLTNTCDINPGSDAARMRRRRADNDNQGDDESDETIEAQCICRNTSFDVGGVAALCAACISQNGKNTDDMDKIMSQCGFSSTTYVAAATSVVAGVTVRATKPVVTTTGSSTAIGSAAKTSAAGTSEGVTLFDLGATRLAMAMAGALVVTFRGF